MFGIPLSGMGFQGRTSHQFPTLQTFLSAFTEPKNNAPFQSSLTIFFKDSNAGPSKTAPNFLPLGNIPPCSSFGLQISINPAPFSRSTRSSRTTASTNVLCGGLLPECLQFHQ